MTQYATLTDLVADLIEVAEHLIETDPDNADKHLAIIDRLTELQNRQRGRRGFGQRFGDARGDDDTVSHTTL